LTRVLDIKDLFVPESEKWKWRCFEVLFKARVGVFYQI
jgi:hypothetical protein